MSLFKKSYDSTWGSVDWKEVPNAEKAIEAMLEAGANLNAKDKFGRTILHNIIRSKRKDWKALASTLVVWHNAKVNTRDENGVTPLMSAICRLDGDQTDIIDVLISAGADVNGFTRDLSRPNHMPRPTMSPLMYAVQYGYPEVAGVLYRSGAKPNAKNNLGKTVVHALNYKNSSEVNSKLVQLFKEMGVDVNVADSIYGNTPLNIAATSGNLPIFKMLVEQGADINHVTPGFQSDYDDATHGAYIPAHTALTNAIWADHPDIVEYALKHGARTDLPEKGDIEFILEETKALLSCHKHHEEIETLIETNGAECLPRSQLRFLLKNAENSQVQHRYAKRLSKGSPKRAEQAESLRKKRQVRDQYNAIRAEMVRSRREKAGQ